MSIPHFKSITEQVADHLRKQLLEGQWAKGMPGQKSLSKQLRVSGQTIELALQTLEKEGLLVGQGAGRRRRIELPQSTNRNRAMRVRILPYDKSGRKEDYLVELFHQLRDAGHDAGFTSKTMMDLGMSLNRIARFVENTEADAWVIVAGSREVLDWFARRPTPAFALFGRMLSVPIASTGPHKPPAMAEAVRRLAELGHQRIVMLTREERRKPEPGKVERAFLEELANLGIATSSYNLPDWEDNPKGLQRCLASLFQFTPPTALIISTLDLYSGTQQFLSHRGIRVPQDVSVIFSDPHPTLEWCEPSLSHISYDSSDWVSNIIRWLKNVSHSKDDRRQIFTKAEFIDGGTIGPAAKDR